MDISKYNAERYSDPTAYAALSHIAQESPFVYICSPYRDDPGTNVIRARRYCRFAVAEGCIPLAPHLYFPQFLSESSERETAFRMNFELLKLCDEIWVFGDDLSEGMVLELSRAMTLCKTIRYFTTSCEEVTSCN